MALEIARSGGKLVQVAAAILGCIFLGGPPLSGQTQGRGEKSPVKPALDASQKARLIQAFGKFPMRFEANEGQSDKRVDFISRGQGYTLFLAGEEAVLSLRSQAVSRRTGVRSQNGKVETGKSTIPESRIPSPIGRPHEAGGRKRRAG